LFDLVHSLLPSEKASFQRAMKARKKKGRHLYLELYEQILQQPHYHEGQLKEHFTGTSFGKSLAFPKSHLYDQVLHHLRAQATDQALRPQMRARLDEIELLVERALPQQALRLLRKLRPRAERYSLPHLVLQCLHWERRATLQLLTGNYRQEITRLAEAEAHWERALQLEREAIRLHDDLYMSLQEFRRKSRPEESVDIQALRQRLEELERQAPLTFDARMASLRGKAHLAHLSENFQEVHDAYAAEVRHWQAHPHQMEARSLRYVRAYGQWLGSKALIQDYGELFPEIARLRAQALDERSRIQVFQVTASLELFYYLNVGRSREALPLIPRIEADLHQFGPSLPISVRMGFFYNLALVLWTAREHGQALKWVHQILQFPAGDVRRDIQLVAPLLEKILYFERGDIGLLESWFRSFRYRRRNQKETDALEELLLGLIRKALDAKEEAEIGKLFQIFGEELETYGQQPGVSRVGLMELKTWAERGKGG